jgi:outer membrane receptor protein involved in Fe transport
LSFAVTDAFTIRTILSYTNAKLAADTPDLGGADGDQVPNSPEWQGGLDFNYDFNVGDLPAYAGLAWTYKGKMPVGFDGYTDDDGTYWQPSAPRLEVGSYSLVDLRAGLSLGKVDLSFYLTNLLDEWAYTSFTSSFVSPSLGVPTRPRTLGVVARWNFF